MTKRNVVAINVDYKGNIVEHKIITAECTGEWSDGTKVWTDEDGDQYTLHKTSDGIFYFILEAVDDMTTSWNINYEDESDEEKITELEKEVLNKIVDEYDVVGIENTEFHNITWDMEDKMIKRWRGAFTSLIKKEIIAHYDDPDFFNPIFPTKKLVKVCKENNINISDKAMQEIENYLR